jgi:hypothetical protein
MLQTPHRMLQATQRMSQATSGNDPLSRISRAPEFGGPTHGVGGAQAGPERPMLEAS